MYKLSKYTKLSLLTDKFVRRRPARCPSSSSSTGRPTGWSRASWIPSRSNTSANDDNSNDDSNQTYYYCCYYCYYYYYYCCYYYYYY